ncbi:MAG: hypothetical protein H6983_24050 [Ectothiorhodospiraceae bacterium]|nr:hypothetical protein [Ectothiorhodospiraceae bacterium]
MTVVGTIERHAVLTADECAAVGRLVRDARKRWILRSAEWPFYTLGAASYIDARAGERPYRALARLHNPWLRQAFGWLYRRVGAVLAARLGAPVQVTEQAAVPGFHVYQACPAFETPVASIHCDRQYALIGWDDGPAPDLAHPLSFTLPVSVPRSGAGLDVWDLPLAAVEGLGHEAFSRLVGERRPARHAYALGELVVHDGHLVHRAAPSTDLQPDDERVTLQGHGLRRGTTWEIYW